MTETNDGRIVAPWTAEQVANLNRFQQAGWWHPFTCGVDSCRAVLVATEQGWTCPDCDYTQGWAYVFMADGAAFDRMDAVMGRKL